MLVVSCAGPSASSGGRPFESSTVIEIAGTFDSQTIRNAPDVTAPPVAGPCALDVLPGGTLLIADCRTGNLLRVESSGQVQSAVRVSNPDGASLLRSPKFMRSDPSGNVYISDGLDDRILVYDSRMRPVTDLTPPYSGLGFPPGRLGGVAVDAYGEIAVADISNRCIYRFDPGGRYLSVLSGDDTPWARLSRPTAVAAADDDGSLFVADPGDRRVVVFDNSGVPRLSFGETDLKDPMAIALGPQGQVYIADPGLNAVVVFSSGGRFVGNINAERLGLPGLIRPTDVAVDDSTLYVADPDNGRILALRFRSAETDQ
jgi:DNA-binding beta-propeller fold protein YncE